MIRTRSVRSGLLALLLSVLSSSAGAAGEAAIEDAIPLPDTILVLSTKIPFQLRDLAASATIVPSGRIRAGAASETREILDAVAGLHTFDLSAAGSGGVVESRGFTSFGETSYLQVLVDGFPLADLENDAVDWSLLAPSQIRRVEVLRGPVAYLYGNAAMAGVVNLITWDRSRPGRIWFQGGGGSDRDLRASAGWSGGSAGLAGGASGFRRTSDGYRDHSGVSRTGATGNLRAALSRRWNLRARLLLHHVRREIPGPLPDSLLRTEPRASWEPFARDDRNADLLLPSIELQGRIGPASELTARIHGDFREVEAVETVYPTGTLDRESRSRSVRAEARFHWRSGTTRPFDLLIGTEGGWGDLESRYFDGAAPTGAARVGAGDVERVSGSVFAWTQIRPAALWSVNAGIRWDGIRAELERPDDPEQGTTTQELAALSPAIGISREIAGEGLVFASAAGSFKAPTLEQLFDQRPYFVPDGEGGVVPVTLSSPALDPQRGFHLDLGGRHRIGSRARLGGTIYYAKSTDEIGFDLARFRYDNIEESTHFGFEGNGSILLDDRAETRLRYTYTRARFDGGPFDGNQINSVPKHRIGGDLEVRPTRDLIATVSLTHVREQWLDEENRFELRPTTFVDLTAQRRFGPVTLFGAVRNLFEEDRPPAGYLTIDEMGADLPLYYPPADRRFEVGLRVEGDGFSG
ncbi:MAG: TonB-dependent receptor plug domain-containing protein [Candidatus Eisenbacteria bacterium]|nr:TonB-dependent receptor plug domain-containing protein [Candidatus Latescibacterota bacterium]MBD3301679.1 TonB-dependent receptor plug domain-containing protein [Candidatus Eisenbacteria bacterium]